MVLIWVTIVTYILEKYLKLVEFDLDLGEEKMLYGEELINPIEKLKVKAQLELIKRGAELQQFITKYLSSLMESGWSFETSAGADLSISTPIVKLGAVGSAGAIYLKKNGDSEINTFHFAGGGATYGAGLIPIPFNFDLSLKDFIVPVGFINHL